MIAGKKFLVITSFYEWSTSCDGTKALVQIKVLIMHKKQHYKNCNPAKVLKMYEPHYPVPQKKNNWAA